jgi:prefoldin subunit 5
MLNPLSLPADVAAALRSVAAIERVLADGFRAIDDRFEQLDRRLQQLPDDIELRLRDHFERQQAGVAALLPELQANREHAELLPGKVDALRAELRELLAEISQVRETIEPLQGPAERMGRLSERLPGGD